MTYRCCESTLTIKISSFQQAGLQAACALIVCGQASHVLIAQS